MPEAPPAPLVTFRIFASHMEADLAKSLLEAFGVECMTSADDCGGQRPAWAFSDGVLLIIRAEDRERAEEIFAVQAEG
ncbi:MAG: hypothetical protein M3N54_01570 [Acidobacteriota bacterium]|nr:hypothetical protein [Acidobacteriota bacterium]